MLKKTSLIITLMLLAFSSVLSACGSNESSGDQKEKVIIGYFPNLNHAAAIVAKEKKFFEEQLGDGVEVEYMTFPDGSAFMTALKTGDIQAGIVGPGPAMNNFTTGVPVNVIAGASTGGTVILARADSGIDKPEDLEGKVFVSPRVGCTHDVQFETSMKELGITSERIGGTMKHVTGKPATYENLFKAGKIDVATAPEPWASVLEAKVGAKVIFDSNQVAFGNTLPAAVLVSNSNLVNENPEMVQKIVNAHIKATEFIDANTDEAIDLTIKGIKDVTGQDLEREIIVKAWDRIDFTYQIDKDAIQKFGDSSFDLKFLKEKPDFTGFVDDQFIN